VAADVLGGGIDHDGRAVIQRAAEQGRGGVVHDQRNAQAAPNSGDLRDGEHGQLGIGQGLGVVGAGARIGGAAEGLRVRGIDEAHFDALTAQGVGEQVPGAAVEVRGADDVVACVGQILNREGRRRLARAHGQRRRAALQGRDALLQDIDGRVSDAGVDIPEFLEREQVGRMLGVAELIGGRLINRRSHRAGGRIGPPACMERQGLRVQLAFGHDLVLHLRAGEPRGRPCVWNKTYKLSRDLVEADFLRPARLFL
jgi:hypothetical protein